MWIDETEMRAGVCTTAAMMNMKSNNGNEVREECMISWYCFHK